MIPVPQHVFERWRAMWHPQAVPEKPWWVRLGDSHALQRCDGLLLEFVLGDGVTQGPGGQSVWRILRGSQLIQEEAISDERSMLERTDWSMPVEPPPVLPGQTWANRYRIEEFLILRTSPPCVQYLTSTYSGGKENEKIASEYNWPPTNEYILVAGPSRYGRDVPWSPPG